MKERLSKILTRLVLCLSMYGPIHLYFGMTVHLFSSKSNEAEMAEWRSFFAPTTTTTQQQQSLSAKVEQEEDPPSSRRRRRIRQCDPSTEQQIQQFIKNRIRGHWSHRQPMHLEFTPWERASFSSSRICKPPHHRQKIPHYCCIGAANQGGGKEAVFTDVRCNHTFKYDDVSWYALGYMQSLPEPAQYYTKVGGDPPDQPCDVCRLMDYLFQHSWRLSFQGDSMMGQTVTGLECELWRRGYPVTRKQYDHPPTHDIAKGKKKWKYGLRHVITLTVEPPPKPKRSLLFAPVEIRFYFMYRPQRDNVQILEILKESDIVVMDHGLHWGYHNRPGFLRDMKILLAAYNGRDNGGKLPATAALADPELLNYTTAAAAAAKAQPPPSISSFLPPRNVTSSVLLPPPPNKLVIWRETTSQHFDWTGGHWRPGIREENGCIPIKGGGDAHNYRFQTMQNASLFNGLDFQNVMRQEFQQQQGNAELVYLPMRNFLNPLYFMHDAKECTHYCLTPHLWLPVFRGLRLALDRQVKRLFEESYAGCNLTVAA